MNSSNHNSEQPQTHPLSPQSFITDHFLLQDATSPIVHEAAVVASALEHPISAPNLGGIPSNSAVTVLPHTAAPSNAVSDTSPATKDQAWKLEADWSTAACAEIIADFRQATRSSSSKPRTVIGAECVKYSCSLCMKSYKRRSDATAHVAEVHLDMAKFFCRYCKFKQFRRWPYERHVRNMHKDVRAQGDGRISKSGRACIKK